MIEPLCPEILQPAASYTAAEVARILFRVSLRVFQRRRARLRREGFPRPVSSIGKAVWSGAALIAWRDRDASRQEGNPNLIELSQRLAGRARAVAGKRSSQA